MSTPEPTLAPGTPDQVDLRHRGQTGALTQTRARILPTSP